MNLFRKNTKEITREEAFKIANNFEPMDIKELNAFSRKITKTKDLFIVRQVGLGDSVISRVNGKLTISDFKFL
jgi:Txe/YoeB family toxin of Txe-Axe toxin-antitoxin module